MKRLSKRNILLALGVVIGAYLCVVIGYNLNNSHKTVATQPRTANIYELWQLTNAERAKNGLKPLVLNSVLNQSAQIKADEMTQTGSFSHYDPRNGQNSVIEYLYKLYPSCPQGSENITDNIYVNDSKHAIDAFMASKPHREALLNPKYHEVGFGISGKYIVQHFCGDK